MFRVVALCAVSILLPAVALAEGKAGSATWVMPGCRTYLNGTGWNENEFRAGFCVGIVEGVLFTPDICVPGEATQGQVVRVVGHYIDARPARQHEPFPTLAIEALKAAWPCRR